MKLVYVLIALGSFAHAATTTAGDPSRKSITITDAYSDSQGNTIVRLTANGPSMFTNGDDNVFLSCNNERCDQLNNYGSDTGPDEQKYMLRDADGAVTNLDLNAKNGTYNFSCPDKSVTQLHKTSYDAVQALQSRLRSGQLNVHSLPSEERREFGAMKEPNGKYLYIDMPEYNADINSSYRVYEGTPGNMHEVKTKPTDGMNREGRFIQLADGRHISMIFPEQDSIDGQPLTSVDDQNLAGQLTPPLRPETGMNGVPNTPCPTADERQRWASQEQADKALDAQQARKPASSTSKTPARRRHHRHGRRRHHQATTPASSNRAT